MHSIKCPSCGHKLKYAAEHAGKKAKCTQCSTAVRLPVADEPHENETGDHEFVFDWGKDRPTVATYQASPGAVWKAVVGYVAGLPSLTVLSENSKKRELVCKNEKLGLIMVFGVSGNQEECELHFAFNDEEVPPEELAKHPNELLQKITCAALIVHLNKKFQQASAGCAVLFAAVLLGLTWAACGIAG